MINTTKPLKILLGQLGSYCDCLYATAVARQIKADNPHSHLTWAIGSIYRSILECNPNVDEIWEIPLSCQNDLLNYWPQFENEALERKKRGDFDIVYLTQVFPNNFKNYDGTLRSSIFRAYSRPITVPVTPVMRLSHAEVDNVRSFAESHRLSSKKHVVLFEYSSNSGQSFVTHDVAFEVAYQLIAKISDICIILSSNQSIQSTDGRIIDGSTLSFRENAELTKYCTLLVGCSSGISWLSTSDWAKQLPMIQLLNKDKSVYASFVHDHEYHGIPIDNIIEMTDCSADRISNCIVAALTEGFNSARSRFHEKIPLDFTFYSSALFHVLFIKGRLKDAISSLTHVVRRYGFHLPVVRIYFITFINFVNLFKYIVFNPFSSIKKRIK